MWASLFFSCHSGRTVFHDVSVDGHRHGEASRHSFATCDGLIPMLRGIYRVFLKILGKRIFFQSDIHVREVRRLQTAATGTGKQKFMRI